MYPAGITKLSYPLSNEEILQFFDGKCEVIRYADLVDKFPLDKYGRCVILIQSNPTNHWVLVMKLNNGSTLFQDSYGMFPSDQFNWIPKSVQKMTKQDRKKILDILASTPDMRYSPYKLQKSKTSISTCGKHACVRALFPDIDENQYWELISALAKDFNIGTDDVVNQIFISSAIFKHLL